MNAYKCRRSNGAPRFRCRAKECARDFSPTSSTLFAFHKMPSQTDLLAIAIFVNEKIALGRVPDDVGPMIASLLSEDNRWIDQRIEVSGGMNI